MPFVGVTYRDHIIEKFTSILFFTFPFGLDTSRDQHAGLLDQRVL